MPTINEAKEAKRLLAEAICMMIRDYETAYDVGVYDVRLVRSATLRDPTVLTCAVEVEVDL